MSYLKNLIILATLCLFACSDKSGADETFEVNPTSLEFSHTHSSKDVIVTTNTDWSAQCNSTWIALEKKGKYSLSINVEANNGNERISTVYFINNDTQKTIGTLSIKQFALSNDFDFAPTGSIDGYDYVDLGLSVKWATYNVGAKRIEEIGDYYAWGETAPYNRDLTYVNYDWDFNPCDPDCVIASIFDAATENWGNSWRMPTTKEQKELVEGCNWRWIENINSSSISGYIGTSLINGKSIFLPASKFISHSSYKQPKDTDGVYWSSSVLTTAGELGFNANTGAECIAFANPGMDNPVKIDGFPMGLGATIRAVVGTPNDYFPDPSNNNIDKDETNRQGFTVNGEIGNHTFVDLGLPSRTLWATYNIGANLPTEYGDYFAWGETVSKETYTDSSYKFHIGYKDSETAYQQFSKYVWDRDFGIPDGKYTLDNTDDAAYVNWGSKWCMPTSEQVLELNKYCSFWRKDIVVNGKKIIGCVGESYINGNQIYIPAAGWEYSNQPNAHMWIWYWTSEVSRYINSRAKFLIFLEGENNITCEDGTNRCNGLPVRAVVKKR